MAYKALRFIFGDQLNPSHSWYKQPDQHQYLYVIAELKQETDYVKHHIQKICAFFAAMENFANALKKSKLNTLYLTLDDTQNDSSIESLLHRLADDYQCEQIEYQYPDEYRLRHQMKQFEKTSDIDVFGTDTEHFLLPFDEISQHFKTNTQSKMEYFYRMMRKRFNVLMDDGAPLGGQWNYDHDNRNKLKKDDLAAIPKAKVFKNPVDHILKRIEQHNVIHFGECPDALLWPTSRQQAHQLLDYFCTYLLPLFGQFQDAMTCQSTEQWSLYHSRLSFALNTKMLHPMQIIQKVLDEFKQRPEEINLAQVEGFIRQILGWREFVRGIYWQNMPQYSEQNELAAKRELPAYFWDGQTNMNCMRHALQQSLQTAYAHHIQRLMITGNFCLLTGIHPDQVDQWYLGIYIDAIEWVEMPNTRGMSQFADGGLIATKPYAAGGNYINKMSDYCKSCHYNVAQKNEDSACPFNSLYWHFLNQHKHRLQDNPRMGMIYKNWQKQSESNRQATLSRAQWCLDNIEKL